MVKGHPRQMPCNVLMSSQLLTNLELSLVQHATFILRRMTDATYVHYTMGQLELTTVT